MKILIAPMGAATPTAGPFSRAKAIALAAIKHGHKPAFCASEDANYSPVENVKNYYCPVPKLFGKMPLSVAKKIFPIIQKLGLQAKKEVKNFEQVLFISGAIAGDFFSTDVEWIRKAISDFKPDIVFAEFRPAAIVAAKLENVKVIADYGFTAQTSYSSSPKYSKNVRKFLLETNLPKIESVLDIFDWADAKVVASSYNLEPFNDEKIYFTGPLISFKFDSKPTGEKNIIFYLGTGTISNTKVIKIAVESFKNSDYQIYIAGSSKNKYTKFDNIHIAERFDFSKLMPDCVAFVNHGGQNSIMTGLIYGVPQIVFPGKIFERKYNANSVQELGAGFYYNEKMFNSETLKNTVKKFESDNNYRKTAKKEGKKLLELGGLDRLIHILENIRYKTAEK